MSPVLSDEHLDILDHLPHSRVLRYQAGEVIYDCSQPARYLYLVTEGRVQVSREIAPDIRVILDIFASEDLFGESALLNLPNYPETAVALENANVMRWTLEKLQSIMYSRPEVGIALGQVLVQRLIDTGNRLESLASDHINLRLVRTLFHLADRLGRPAGDGWTEITGFKHRHLAGYISASRATVTYWMNYLRQRGLLRHSRDLIQLNREALQRWLRSNTSHQERDPLAPSRPEARQTDTEAKSLSPRELQVMHLVAEGLKNGQIAERLQIREQTVKNHLRNIFETLHVSNRHQAVTQLASTVKEFPENLYAPAVQEMRQLGC